MSDLDSLLRALGISEQTNALTGANNTDALIRALGTPQEKNALMPPPQNLFESLVPYASPLSPLGKSLLEFPPPAPASPTHSSTNPLSALVAQPDVRRKVYFAFDYDDQIRVNDVRQVGKVGNEARTFYDRSIWVSRNIRDDQTLKNLMRAAVKQSSAICVLIGTDTWRSRWVKYEIARAVIDERGLFAVHLNGINHNIRRKPDQPGYNPLEVMGVYRSHSDKFYLYEKRDVVSNTATGTLSWQWQPYEDYTDPVPLPRFIPNVEPGYVMPLAAWCDLHDFMGEAGYWNIGNWIDTAAKKVGR